MTTFCAVQGRRLRLVSTWMAVLQAAMISFGIQSLPAAAQQRPVPVQAAVPLEIEEISERGRSSTVTVIRLDRTGRPNGLGSGVVIRANGTIVTNWHVLAGADRAVVVGADGTAYRRVVFLEGDRRLDIAVIQVVDALLEPAETTIIIPQPGARVVVIGAPQGLAQTVSDGIVSALRLVQSRQLVQITAPISPGSSGGPVFDKYGRVFAIATAQLVDGQALNFATPLRYAFALLPLGTSPRTIRNAFGGRSP